MRENDDIIEIRIDFQRGEGDPSRVFRAMTGLIESTQRLDEHLSATISTKVKTSLILQDVEAGSIRAKLKAIIEEIPDEALKEGEVKKVIGHFLRKAKHKVIDWCSRRDEIKGRKEVKQLEAEIHKLAEGSNVRLLPAYGPIETSALLSDISSINTAMENLTEKDKATFNSSEGQSQYNPKLSISEDIIRDVVTKEAIVTEGQRILKVKKPDYLGFSKWSFKYLGHLIEAKIIDENWLNDFQNRQVVVQPGDSLRVNLREELSYGYDNEIVHTHYEILNVIEIIPAPNYTQGKLFEQ
jgi:hypothetical protein